MLLCAVQIVGIGLLAGLRMKWKSSSEGGRMDSSGFMVTVMAWRAGFLAQPCAEVAA